MGLPRAVRRTGPPVRAACQPMPMGDRLAGRSVGRQGCAKVGIKFEKFMIREIFFAGVHADFVDGPECSMVCEAVFVNRETGIFAPAQLHRSA